MLVVFLHCDSLFVSKFLLRFNRLRACIRASGGYFEHTNCKQHNDAIDTWHEICSKLMCGERRAWQLYVGEIMRFNSTVIFYFGIFCLVACLCLPVGY